MPSSRACDRHFSLARSLILCLVRPLRALSLKTTLLATFFVVTNACFGDGGELSRATKFASPEQFVEAARGFHPAAKPSELSYIFAAPELGHDESTYGKTVFAETISEVTELFRTPDTCAYFVRAEPKTDYTRSYVAALFVLTRDDQSAWRIRTIERFFAIGVGGWIECKVIHGPTKSKGSSPATFQIIETDAGRHDISEERVYTLVAGNGPRLKPVK
jgi:hypothetical protein